MNHEEKIDTTQQLLQQLNLLNNKPSDAPNQDKYLRLPYTNKPHAYVIGCPKEFGDELVVSLEFLKELNSATFIYDDKKAIYGQEGADGKPIIFTRKFNYISYKKLQIIQEAMIKKFQIVKMGEYGDGLAAKQEIKAGEMFFYPGILTSMKAVAETKQHQPYAVGICLQGNETALIINAAGCKGGYAQLAQHAPCENPPDIQEKIALSNIVSAHYYTKVKINSIETIIPLLGYECAQDIQPGQGILASYGDNYWKGQLKTPSYFNQKLKPVIELVQVNVLDKRRTSNLTSFTLSREAMASALESSYVPSPDDLIILPGFSQKILREKFKESGFVSCNGLMLPAVILVNKKDAKLVNANETGYLLVSHFLSIHNVVKCQADIRSVDSPTFVKQLKLTGKSIQESTLLIPISLFQQSDKADLEKLIDYVEQLTGFRLTMCSDPSLIPQASEDKKQESSTETTLRP